MIFRRTKKRILFQIAITDVNAQWDAISAFFYLAPTL